MRSEYSKNKRRYLYIERIVIFSLSNSLQQKNTPEKSCGKIVIHTNLREMKRKASATILYKTEQHYRKDSLRKTKKMRYAQRSQELRKFESY